MLIGSSLVCMTRGRTVCRGGANGASSDGLAHGVCVADVADVAGGNSDDGVAGACSGESDVWHKTVICWLVLVAYLYIQCENYAFAALPLLVFAASKVRREPDFLTHRRGPRWTKILNNRHSPLFRFSLKAYISRILRCIMYRRG